MANIQDAIKAIDPQIANITSIKLTCDNQKRGSTTKSPTGSIYVWRDGSITVGSVGGTLSIVKQGGNPLWEGQINPTPGSDPGFTRAQEATITAIMEHIALMADMNKIEVES